MQRAVFAAAVSFALAACSGGGADDSATAKAQAKAEKTVIDAQLKALQKAKDVQKTVDDQAKSTDQAIDDQGG